MVKLSTPVAPEALPVRLSLSDKVTVLGSCFADSIGTKLLAAGFDACVNPFGTLYNPVSIANSVARLQHAVPFRRDECVQMGAGAGLVCSWWHHTSFARASEEDFLKDANTALEQAAAFWKHCNKVIITLGTAMVWRLISNGEVVSNCLKRPSAEFSHEMLSAEQISTVLSRLIAANPDKEFIFTVSPIRHLGEGAHRNSLSKAALLLGLDAVGATYFPAYEILLDELRDYRYYAEDLVHPSKTAVDLIWERFLDAATLPEEREAIVANEKNSRRHSHVKMH